MKSHTFFLQEPDRVETSLWAVLAVVALLAIALAGMPAVAPPDWQAAGANSPHAAALVQSPSDHFQNRLSQFVADMRTLVAALRYLMQAETDPATIA